MILDAKSEQRIAKKNGYKIQIGIGLERNVSRMSGTKLPIDQFDVQRNCRWRHPADAQCLRIRHRNAGNNQLNESKIEFGIYHFLTFLCEYLQVQADDGLPQKLCVNCSSRIIDAYILREKCKKSAKLLRKIFNLSERSDSTSPPAIEQKTIETQTDACGLSDAKVQTAFDEYDSNDPAECERAEYDIIDANDETELDGDSIEVFSIANYDMDDDMVTEENVYLDDSESVSMRAKQEQAEIDAADGVDDANDANVPIDDFDDVEEVDVDDEIAVFDRCSYCNKKFNNPSDFQSHVNEHMEILPLILTSANFFRCSRCRLVFAKAEQLCTHIEAPDSCTIDTKNGLNGDNCVDYQFLGDPIVNNIDQIRMFSCQKNDVDGAIACEFCDYVFESFMDFIEHFNDVHLMYVENTEELYEDTANLRHCCGICAKTYMNIKDIMFHVYFHQTTFYCPFVGCSDTYNKSHYLNRHIAREHFRVEKHTCEHCQWETNSYTLFKKHVRHECSARKFVCTTCGACLVLCRCDAIFFILFIYWI